MVPLVKWVILAGPDGLEIREILVLLVLVAMRQTLVQLVLREILARLDLLEIPVLLVQADPQAQQEKLVRPVPQEQPQIQVLLAQRGRLVQRVQAEKMVQQDTRVLLEEQV
jgi:hypothetical protein